MAMRIVFQVPIFASVHTKRPGKAGSSRQKTHSRQFHCCFSSGEGKKHDLGIFMKIKSRFQNLLWNENYSTNPIFAETKFKKLVH